VLEIVLLARYNETVQSMLCGDLGHLILQVVLLGNYNVKLS
jgi:hypothetical protein